MSLLECKKCQQSCIFKPRPKEGETFGAPCDSCKVVLCKKCSELNTTEAHSVALTQKRILLFYCTDCKSSLKDLPKFRKLLEQCEELKSVCENKDQRLENMEMKHKEIIAEFELHIDQLSVLNLEKDNEIKKINAKSTLMNDDLRNELTQARKDLNVKDLIIEELKKQMANHDQAGLTEQISQLSTEKNTTEKELQLLQNELAKAKNDLNDLNLLKNNLLTSIETLSVQNSLYLDEIKKLKNELCINLNKWDKEQSLASSLEVPKPVIHKITKNQILLFGNKSCVSGTGLLVKSFCQSKYDINCQYSDFNVPAETLIKQFAPPSKNFTKKDFVVLFAGMVNALQGKVIDDSCWDTISEISTRTNLIIVTPPYCDNRKVLNNFIYNFNLDLKKHLYQRCIKCYYLPSDSLMSAYERNRNGYLDYEIKRRLSRFICNQIIDQEYNPQNFPPGNHLPTQP